MRIALLDDDATQTKWVKDILQEAGHNCHEFNVSHAFIKCLRDESFDLLVLDWNIPEMSGPEVLAWIRRNIVAVMPVIFMTNRVREEDIVAGLNAGADDYIFKPARKIELLARINAVLRRAYPIHNNDKEMHFGFTFNIKEKLVLAGDKSIDLTHKEFDLALLFFRHLSRPLSRTHILESVWGRDCEISTRTMDTHVSRIRSKLDLRADNGFKLATVYSYGYRLEKIEENIAEDIVHC
jgi:DNA-binding response OmpR family regulator